jgi:tetratricopeptide (TPR) repeat protein
MQRYLSILLSIILLGGIAIGTNLWLNAFNRSITRYRSPMAEVPSVAAEAELPKNTGVILVIVSGLGSVAFDSLALPNLTQIAQVGAQANVQSVPPTFSQTSRVALLTGAPPETNGAPPIDIPSVTMDLLEVDTILARASEAQLQTMLLGASDWRYLLPRNYLDDTFLVDVEPGSDQLIAENALLAIDEDRFDLTIVHFAYPEYAAAYFGNDAYQQAMQQVDEAVARIYQRSDLGENTLIVVGDHGHTDYGGYGGDEVEVTNQPLIMAGQMVVPGSYSDVWHTDIAPTISALLGVAPPAAAQGRALFEMLRFDQKARALAQIELARQRIALVNYVFYTRPGEPAPLSDPLAVDLAKAESALDQANLQGAITLAQLGQEEADQRLAVARYNARTKWRWLRLMIAAIILLGWAAIMWRRRGPYALVIIVAVAITVGLYHALYRLQGYQYSISSIANFNNLPYVIAQLITVSLLAGGGLVLIVLMLTGEDKFASLLGVGYGFSVLVTFVFALPLFWVFWQNGLIFQEFLPDMNTAFWQITALFQTMFGSDHRAILTMANHVTYIVCEFSPALFK